MFLPATSEKRRLSGMQQQLYLFELKVSSFELLVLFGDLVRVLGFLLHALLRQRGGDRRGAHNDVSIWRRAHRRGRTSTTHSSRRDMKDKQRKGGGRGREEGGERSEDQRDQVEQVAGKCDQIFKQSVSFRSLAALDSFGTLSTLQVYSNMELTKAQRPPTPRWI